jgi:hypothetical protein
LTALLELAPYDDYLMVRADEVDDEQRRRLLDDHQMVVIGRTANGYFGPVRSLLGATIDATPVAWVDRQGGDPELAGKDLASFLAIVHFFPDFFGLTSDAATWDENHRDFTPDDTAKWELLGKLPGVRSLKRSTEVVRLLAATSWS